MKKGKFNIYKEMNKFLNFSPDVNILQRMPEEPVIEWNR